MRASPEAIYLTLFLQRGARCARELIGHLRRVKILRRPRAAGRANRGQGQIIDAVSIRERPAELEDARSLATGRRRDHRLVEHAHRDAGGALVALPGVDGTDTDSVVSALTRQSDPPWRALPIIDLGSWDGACQPPPRGRAPGDSHR